MKVNERVVFALVALLAALDACSPVAPMPGAASARLHPAPQLPVDTEAEPQAPSAPAAASALALPASPSPPPQAGCSLDIRNYRPNSPLNLRLSPGSRPFASCSSAEIVRIQIPFGESEQGAYAQLDHQGMVVGGWVDTASLALYAKRSQLMASVVRIGPSSALRWKRASAGSVTVALADEPKLRMLRGPAELDVACGDLSLMEGEFNSLTEETDSETTTPTFVEARQPKAWMQISASARGPAVVAVDVSQSEEEDFHVALRLLERKGDWAKLTISLGTVGVVGWVRQSTIRVDKEAGGIGLLGSGGDPNAPTAPWGLDESEARTDAAQGAGRTCAWNAPLLARQQGEFRTVGMVPAGRPLQTGSVQGGLREIRSLSSSVELAQGASFWVPEKFVYLCGAGKPTATATGTSAPHAGSSKTQPRP